ncbi:MAG: Mrp/NBP35 family ATP-binding protein [Candidatus Dormibacteraeota bacterium]|nr:Mrp/NBP35 family ATP-binding protein [Candidatus Dormibacteraeota bacterium]
MRMADSASIAELERALSRVIDPELHRPMLQLGMLRDLAVDGDVASVRVVLTTPACPLKDRIQSDVAAAVVGVVPGINRVLLTWDSDVSSTRGLPGRQEIPGVRNAVAVSAGKGGVGKSTVAINVALALLQAGARVGLLDADVYGPNVPIMLGLREQPRQGADGRMQPMAAHGLKVVSFGTILQPGQPVIWRGPMLAKALREFLYEVAWGELDYLVIDLPPGTGDVQLSLAQSMPMTGAVICTTPQDVSIADVSRGIEMFRKLNVPVLGVVENMSGFICPHCNERTDIFGSGGGRTLSERYELPFLGAIPLDPRIRTGDGDGRPLMVAAPDGPVASVFREVASHIAAEVSKENFAATAGPVMPGPRVPVNR